MMIMASICGMNLFTGGLEELEPSFDDLEAIVADAFLKADRDRSGLISYDEFVKWARSNRDLMAGLETLNKLALDAKNDCISEDSASERDEGHLSDAVTGKERGFLAATLRGPGGGDEGMAPPLPCIGGDNSTGANTHSRRAAASMTTTNSGTGKKLLNSSKNKSSVDYGLNAHWKGMIHEPTNFIYSDRKLTKGPGANLELAWAFGYRAQTCRNNLR